MAKSKLKSGGNAVAYCALVIGCLVAVNLIGTRLFGRADLTEDKVYSLSPASKELVKHLPDRVIAKAYISTKDVPPQVAQVGKYLRDILDEYKANSGGKFQWEAIDPTGDPKKESEASSAGIHKLQLQQLSKEKVSVAAMYMGVAFEYGDKTEKMPQVSSADGSGLEYEISSILKRLTVKKKKLGFAAGQGELGQQGMGMLWGALSQNYDVVPVQLSGGTTPPKIPDDVDALIIAGPKQPYKDDAKRAIDDFLMQGKAVAFLIDGMALDTPRGQMPPDMQMPKIARKNDTGLDTLLGAYGFKVNEDIVMDAQNARGASVINGQMYLVNQPYFPIVSEKELEKHDITEKLRGIIFPLASSVELVGPMKAAAGGGGELAAIAHSTERSWEQTGFFLMDPTRKIEPAADAKKGPFTFAYAYKGPLKSAYATAPAQGGMSTPEGDKAPLGESKAPVRLVVVGDSDFASDEFMHGGREVAMLNGNFFLNICDWLVQDEVLKTVRSKGMSQRPLHFEESTPVKVKIANMLGLPLAFIGYGLVRWRMRRARRAKYSEAA